MLWALKLQILVILAIFDISQGHKMQKIQFFKKSIITFGKHHRWTHLAKNWGHGPSRSLKVGHFMLKLVIFSKI